MRCLPHLQNNPIRVSWKWNSKIETGPERLIYKGFTKLGLHRTGHMIFLTGQDRTGPDRTPKFARQVMQDWAKSGLISSACSNSFDWRLPWNSIESSLLQTSSTEISATFRCRSSLFRLFLRPISRFSRSLLSDWSLDFEISFSVWKSSQLSKKNGHALRNYGCQLWQTGCGDFKGGIRNLKKIFLF